MIFNIKIKMNPDIPNATLKSKSNQTNPRSASTSPSP